MIRMPATTTWKTLALTGMLVLWAALTFSSALTEISFCFALAMVVMVIKQERQVLHVLKLQKGIIGALCLFILIAVMSMLWSENRALSFRGVGKVLQQTGIFFMALLTFRDAASLSKWQKCFIWVLALSLLNGFYQYTMGYDFIRGFEAESASSGLRVSGSFKSYGLFATFLLCAIPVAGGLFMAATKKKRRGQLLLLAALMAAGLFCLYLTRSRGAFVAWVLGCGLFLVWNGKWKWILTLLLLSGIGLFFLPRSMVIHLDAEGKEQSLVERYYLWDRAVQVIKAKPVTGTGINTYSTVHSKYDKTRNWRVRDYYAHNGYLQMAAEIGIPGFLAFLAFWILLYRQCLGVLKCNSPPSGYGNVYMLQGLMLGCLNFLIIALVDTPLHSPGSAMMLWYLAGVLSAYLQIVKEDRTLTEASNTAKV